MKFIRDTFDKIKPHFEKGGKWEKFYFIYEAQETLFFQPNHVTKPRGAHIRDANDMKRMMITVIAALVPVLLFGIWNVGNLHYEALTPALLQEELGDSYATIQDIGLLDKFMYGAFAVLPIIIVCYAVGLGIEFAFATVRRHPVNEGFLVTGLLLPLIVPPTTPLWQVALATAFAVVIGKEVFGGTGMNFLNPALTARAFLFFAYPGQLSGDKVWFDLGLWQEEGIKGFSGATVLGNAVAKEGQTYFDYIASSDAASAGVQKYGFCDMFFGFIPGSIGETSTFLCIVGAAILILTAVGSWRIMLSMLIGGLAMAYVIELLGADFFGADKFYYHIIAGGFAFGAVFMATDPVSASHTNTGKWIYGFLAGALAIIVRTVNPAYPEGVMLAILLMNVFAPLIDYYVLQANKKRRLSRATV